MELTKLHIEWLEAQIRANDAQNAYFKALAAKLRESGTDIAPEPEEAPKNMEPVKQKETSKKMEPVKSEETPKAPKAAKKRKPGRPATLTPGERKLRKRIADRVRNARLSFRKLGYDTDIKDYAELIKYYANALGLDVLHYPDGREDVALKELLNIARALHVDPKYISIDAFLMASANVGVDIVRLKPDTSDHDAKEKEAPRTGTNDADNSQETNTSKKKDEELNDIPGLSLWTNPRDTMPNLDRKTMVTNIVSLHVIAELPWYIHPGELAEMSKEELCTEATTAMTEWSIKRDYGVTDNDEVHLMALYSLITNTDEEISAKMSRDDLLAFFSRPEVIDCLRRDKKAA